MRRLSPVALLAALVCLAGCGGGGGGGASASTSTGPSALASKPPAVVAAAAAKAAKAASSFHISGQIHSSGKDVGVDFSFLRGKGATGTLTLNGAKVDVVLIGSEGYLRASSAFFKQYGKQAGAFAQLLADKWLKFPANNPQFGSITSQMNAGSLLKSLSSNHGKLQNQGDTTYQGQSVVAIHDASKQGTVYVAASGTPYPVALVRTGKGAGKIEFDDWNQPVTLTAPKGALDLSQFGG
jgi:hypothetical protein